MLFFLVSVANAFPDLIGRGEDASGPTTWTDIGVMCVAFPIIIGVALLGSWLVGKVVERFGW